MTLFLTQSIIKSGVTFIHLYTIYIYIILSFTNDNFEYIYLYIYSIYITNGNDKIQIDFRC